MIRWRESWTDIAGFGRGRRMTLVRFMRSAILDYPSYEERVRDLLDPRGDSDDLPLPARGALRDYAAAHVLARCMLSEAAACDASRIRFGTTPLGRPEVLGPAAAARFGLSLAHADGIAVCGIAENCDIGVEVASLRAVGPDPLATAESLFSRRELARLRALEPEHRPGHFLFLRTRMEAIAKARGAVYACAAGILATDSGTAWRAPSPLGHDGVDAAEGRIESWRLTPCHQAAVAILGAPRAAIEVRLEEVAAESPAAPAPRRPSWGRL